MLGVGCAKKGEVRAEWERQDQVRSVVALILKSLDLQLQEVGVGKTAVGCLGWVISLTDVRHPGDSVINHY